MPFVRSPAPGHRALYAERHGEAGLPVLFLHGAGSNAATWWQQLPAFAAKHVCITVDLRCFGRSAAPMDEFRHEHFVADVLAVLDHFALPKVVVVGQSLGGMVGLRLALQHPGRVAAFVACDSPLGVDQPAILEALERRARTAASKTHAQRALGARILQRSTASRSPSRTSPRRCTRRSTPSTPARTARRPTSGAPRWTG